MANWSKRTSRKSGTYSRTTKTTNSKGGSTTSYSGRVGSGPRTTESIKQQNGKVVHRRYTTEYHPTLGTKRTTKTVYASSNAKLKKPKKAKKFTPRRRKTSNRSYSGHYVSTPTNWALWGHVALVLVLLSIGWWSLWLIYGSYWLYVFLDDVL